MLESERKWTQRFYHESTLFVTTTPVEARQMKPLNDIRLALPSLDHVLT